MAQPKDLSGPDLAAGVALSSLADDVPLHGHAQGDATSFLTKFV